MAYVNKGSTVSTLALFASLGTLVCCALPIALVTLGMGSVVAALTLQLPILVTLSEYKTALFSVSAGLLAIAAWLLFRRAACPAAPGLASRCRRANRTGRRILWVASSVWLLGLVAAYLLLPLRQMIDALPR